MPLYEGETLKEAIQKAVRGENFDTGTLTGRYPLPDAAECAWVTVALKKLENELGRLEQEAQRLRSRMGQLQLDAVVQAGFLTAELITMAIPLARIARVRGIIRSILSAVRRGLNENPFATIAILLAEAAGVFAVVLTAQRIVENVLEIGHVLHELRDLGANLERLQLESENLGNKFSSSNCALHPELPMS